MVNSQVISAPFYEESQAKIRALKRAGVLPAAARVGIGSRCLDAPHRGRGLLAALRGQLYRQVAPTLDLYFATIRHSNGPSLRYHEREGYRPVARDADKTYFTFPVAQGAQQLPPAEALAAPYLVRPGRPEDATALEALNLKWAYLARNTDVAQGFLMSVYSEADFEAIIAAHEIAVLELLPLPHAETLIKNTDSEQLTPPEY